MGTTLHALATYICIFKIIPTLEENLAEKVILKMCERSIIEKGGAVLRQDQINEWDLSKHYCKAWIPTTTFRLADLDFMLHSNFGRSGRCQEKKNPSILLGMRAAGLFVI